VPLFYSAQLDRARREDLVRGLRGEAVSAKLAAHIHLGFAALRAGRHRASRPDVVQAFLAPLERGGRGSGSGVPCWLATTRRLEKLNRHRDRARPDSRSRVILAAAAQEIGVERMDRAVIRNGRFGCGERLGNHLAAEYPSDAAALAPTGKAVFALRLDLKQFQEPGHELFRGTFGFHRTAFAGPRRAGQWGLNRTLKQSIADDRVGQKSREIAGNWAGIFAH
jgi:hypothetical protein